MSQTLKMISKHFVENANSLAIEVVETVLSSMSLKISNQKKEQTIEMYVELFEFLGSSIVEKQSIGVPGVILEWSKKNAKSQLGLRISEIVLRYSPTREVLNDLITNLSEQNGLTLRENSSVIKLVNQILDLSLNETVLSFEELSDKERKEAQKEAAELSAPVVPIKEGVAVVPLIGTFDEYRITYLGNKVLPKIVEMQVRQLIVDYSGVITLDLEFTYALAELGKMLELLDIEIIVTGIQPQLAQVIVQSGIDVGKTRYFANLKHALEYI
ncbi:STAS domain-containing protein [Fictibacillus sp. S7]|uniref:STAS domain-containing protein n=1 Tax=Fictibacillus sp. S7 TaxID=2212476 RepID=UPI0013E931B8|nr:STAS domain-containing protein [Fictibacillus sp. S7]